VLELRILDALTVLRQMSTKKRPRQGTLTKLVEERTDVTPEDLEKFFEKQSDVFSPVWLLLAGLILGGGTVGLVELIKEGSVIPPSFTGVWIIVYNVIFWVAVAFILLGLVIVGYFIVRYNPLTVQQFLMRDYLDAKAKLKDRLRQSPQDVPNLPSEPVPVKSEPFNAATTGENGHAMEKVKFYWDFERNRLTSTVVLIFSAFVAIVTILNAQVASSVIRLNPFAEVGALVLIFVYLVWQISRVGFRMNKLVHQTDRLLTKATEGGTIPSLRELCGIEYESKSGWDHLLRDDPQAKIEIVVLIIIGAFLLYLGFGGPL
jgi:amino acid transporter